MKKAVRNYEKFYNTQCKKILIQDSLYKLFNFVLKIFYSLKWTLYRLLAYF